MRSPPVTRDRRDVRYVVAYGSPLARQTGHPVQTRYGNSGERDPHLHAFPWGLGLEALRSRPRPIGPVS